MTGTTLTLTARVTSSRAPAGRARTLLGSSVAKLAGGTAAAQLLAVLLSPVISRLYGPRDFGLLGSFVAIVTILNVIGTLRYELAVPLPEDEITALDLLLLGFLANALIVAALFALLLGLAGPLARSLDTPALAPYLLWLLPPTLFATGAFQLVSSWAIRREQYGWLARRNLARGASSVVTQVALGAAGLAPAGLLLGTAAGSGAGSLGIARRLWRDERALARRVSVPGMIAAGRRYIRFPLYSTWSGVINSAGVVVPFLVLARFYGPTAAGWFTFTSRVVLVPVVLVGDAITQVYTGAAAASVRHRPEQLRELFTRTTRRLVLVGTPLLVLIAGSAVWAFPLVFGARWREAGVYALILLPMSLSQFVVAPLSRTLSLVERQRLQLGWDVGRLLLTTSSLVLPWAVGAGPRLTIGCYSAAMTAAYAALWSLSRRSLPDGAR